jgi:hypothetical protein
LSAAAIARVSRSLQLKLGEDSRWLCLLSTVTVLEFVWWALCWRAGIAPAPYFGRYLALSFAALAAALALRFALRPKATRAPWVSVILGTLLIALGASLFLPLKYAIPGQVPFWLDVPLSAGERTLFGIDPWALGDRIFGWALVPMDRIYGLWLPVQSLILFSVMLLPPSKAKARALIAYALAWFLLGVVAATLLASAGPIFHDRLLGGHDFAAMENRLRTGGGWVVRSESDAMWASFASQRPGFVAGISAMPSLHIAISVWMWLAARALAPRAAPFALGYAAFMWVASVELGWHYFSDGLAGVLGMVGIWWLSSRINAKRQLPGFF